MSTQTPAAGGQQSSTFRLTIEAGRWSSAGLRGLPRGGSLSIDVATDGPIEVLLFDEGGFKEFPGRNLPLVQGETSDNYGFQMLLPESGDYFLVADNRDGGEARVLVVRVTAAAPGVSRMSAKEYQDTANRMLAMVEGALRKVFLMDDVNLRTEPCGVNRSFADDEDIVVCLEYAMVLLLAIEDKEAASPAMMFNIFQRLAEIFLARSTDAEPSVEHMDELATALMVLLNYRTQAETQAKYFEDAAHVEAVRGHVAADDPHPLDTQRAARIRHWTGDVDLLRRWQHTFIQSFQTETLLKLEANPPEWLDKKQVEDELASRRHKLD